MQIGVFMRVARRASLTKLISLRTGRSVSSRLTLRIARRERSTFSRYEVVDSRQSIPHFSGEKARSKAM